MSIPAIRRSTIESRVSREEEIQALDDPEPQGSGSEPATTVEDPKPSAEEIILSSEAANTFTSVTEGVFAIGVPLLGMTLIVSVSMLFISRSRNGY